MYARLKRRREIRERFDGVLSSITRVVAGLGSDFPSLSFETLQLRPDPNRLERELEAETEVLKAGATYRI